MAHPWALLVWEVWLAGFLWDSRYQCQLRFVQTELCLVSFKTAETYITHNYIYIFWFPNGNISKAMCLFRLKKKKKIYLFNRSTYFFPHAFTSNEVVVATDLIYRNL